MPFELTLRYATPLTPLEDLDEVLKEFLRLVGYLPEHDDARSGEGPTEATVAYRLVRECFLKDPRRPWYAEEMAAVLGTSKPTVYRHLNRLKVLDMLEEVAASPDGKGRKGYRIRFGRLAQAWDFTEANAQNALRRYRETVDHLQHLTDSARPAATPDVAAPAAGARERRSRA